MLRQANKRIVYIALQQFLNKIKYFLTILKNVFILNALYKLYGSKIMPNETLGLIFDPYCLIPSISIFAENWFYCVGLLTLCGYINFVNFTNCSRTFGGHCSFFVVYLKKNHNNWFSFQRPNCTYLIMFSLKSTVKCYLFLDFSVKHRIKVRFQMT